MAATAPEPAFWDDLGWQPSQAQRDQLVELQGLLQSWNERVNLTRLVNGDDFWIGQVFDSLWPLAGELQSADEPQHWIDVGTGGGFPGLAIAIALPQAQVTLLDSVGRKTAAVEAMASSLGLCRSGAGPHRADRNHRARSPLPRQLRSRRGPGCGGRSCGGRIPGALAENRRPGPAVSGPVD